MTRKTLICLLLLLAQGYSAVASSAEPRTTVTQPPAAKQVATPLLIPAAKAAKPSASKSPTAARKVPAKPAAKKSANKTPSAKASKSVTGTKLAPVKLNLSLPPELVEDMELGKPVAEIHDEPLLPPMFGDAPKQLSPYQLSGKLITNDRQRTEDDNYLDEVDGAQLSIEYRQ